MPSRFTSQYFQYNVLPGRNFLFISLFMVFSSLSGFSQEEYYMAGQFTLWQDSIAEPCSQCFSSNRGSTGINMRGGISFGPDGILYVLANYPANNIYTVDLLNADTTLFFSGPATGNLVNMGGMVAMGNGIFYSIPIQGSPSDSLYMWDTNAGVITSIGKLSYLPYGDIWLANGVMYYLGSDASGVYIVQLDLSDPSNSQAILQITYSFSIYGFTATPDPNVFLGIIYSNGWCPVISLNILDGSIHEICKMPKHSYLKWLSSIYEHQINSGENFIDLDCDDSSLATGSDFNGTILDCLTEGGVPVSDTDIIIKIDGLIESMVFEIENPEDGINEVFTLSGPTPGIMTDGEGTPTLTLYSEGAATIDHFINALKLVRYDNQSLSPTGGMRVIQVYFETETGNESNSANAFIEVIELPQLQIDLGPDQEFCEGSTIVLDAGGNTWDYEWSTGASTESIAVYEGGIYSVTVSSGDKCPAEDEIEILELPLINISLSGDTEICDGENAVLIITTDAPFDIDIQVLVNPGISYFFTLSEATFEFIDVPYEHTEYTITNVMPSEASCVNIEDDYQYIFVYDSSIDTVEFSLCEGDSVLVGNDWHDQSGFYPLMLETIHGCDSMLQYSLSFLPAYTVLLHELTCDSSEAGVFNMHINNPDGCDTIITRTVSLQMADTTLLNAFSCRISETGVTQQHFSNQSGCDSVVITSTIWTPPADTSQQVIKTCDSLQFGIFHQMLTGTDGCDSIVRIEVIVDVPDTTLLFATSCNPSDIGVFEETYVNTHSCDSIVIRTVSFSERDSSFVTSATCDPGSVGIFVSSYENIYGCDSIVTEAISLIPSNEVFVNSTTCDPLEAGSFSTIFVNQHGCDSILYETIHLLPSSETFIESTTCISGEAGVFVSTLVNQDGCDSVITHTVTFTASAHTIILQHTCDPLQAGVIDQIYPGQSGCDSLVTTITELYQLPALQLIASDYNGFGVTCNGEDDGAIITSLSGEPVNFLWSNGITSDHLSGVGAGVYTLTITDINGCSASSSISITEPEEVEINVVVEQPGCTQQGGLVTVFPDGGVLFIEYSIDDINYQSAPEFLGLLPGNYTITAMDGNGCIAKEEIIISDHSSIDVELGEDKTIASGEFVLIESVINIPEDSLSWIEWFGEGIIDCDHCLSQNVSPRNNSMYIVEVSDLNGCVDADTIMIFVGISTDIFIPNIFSPNGDNYNDHLIISAGEDINQILEFTIYDRWGNMVFNAPHFQPGDLLNSWNGRMNGQPVNSGVYAYTLIAELKGGGQVIRYGDVTLLR